MKNRYYSHELIPCTGYVQTEVCKYVFTIEHHREGHRFGKSVCITVKCKRYHCRLIKTCGHFIKCIEIIKLRYRISYCILYRVALCVCKRNIRSCSRKCRRKKCAHSNKLEVYTDICFTCKLVIYKVSYYLRLVTTAGDPYFEYIILVYLSCSTEIAVVSKEAVDECRNFISRRFSKISLRSGKSFFIINRTYRNIVQKKRLVLRAVYPCAECTDIALHCSKVSRNLIFIGSHLIKCT